MNPWTLDPDHETYITNEYQFSSSHGKYRMSPKYHQVTVNKNVCLQSIQHYITTTKKITNFIFVPSDDV